MLKIYTNIGNLIMNRYVVLMRDKNGVQVKVKVSAKSQKQAELLAEDERADCIAEHARLERTE